MQRRASRWRSLGLLPLPLLVAAVVGVGMAVPEPATGPPAEWSAGWVDARATFLPAPPMNQMIAPMPMNHSDQVQVVLQLHNTTDAPVTVPFNEIRLHLDQVGNGVPVAATSGLDVPQTIRPHAAVEERLRFNAPPHSDRVRLTIPDGSGEITLALRVVRTDREGVRQSGPPQEPAPHHGGH